MEKFIKENILVVIAPILVIGALGYFTYTNFTTMMDSINNKTEKTALLATKKAQLDQIRAKKVQESEIVDELLKEIEKM